MSHSTQQLDASHNSQQRHTSGANLQRRAGYGSSRALNRRARLTFAGALAGEIIKLWSLNSTRILLAVTVALSAGMAALSAWSTTFIASINPLTGATLDDPQPIAAANVWSLLGASSSTAGLVIGIFGVMAMTSEYTTSSIQSSLAANPRRGTFYAAKSVAVAVLALVGGVIGMLVAGAVIVAMTSGHDVTPLSGDQWRIIPVIVAGCPGALMLTSLMALGLGGLTRSTVGGVCSVVGLLMVLSTVVSLTSLIASKIKWLGTLAYLTPDSAMNNFLSAGILSGSTTTVTVDAQGASAQTATNNPGYWIPEWWQSGLIFLAWVVLFWIAGLIVTKRADIK